MLIFINSIGFFLSISASFDHIRQDFVSPPEGAPISALYNFILQRLKLLEADFDVIKAETSDKLSRNDA